MIQIKGIDHVAINVRNLDHSVEFYKRVIGLNITQREPSTPGVEFFLDCGPSLINLIQAQDLTRTHGFENEGLGANHFSFKVHSKDFEPMIKRLESLQIKIEFAKKREKSWSLYFCDLDGNKLEVTAWPMEDGISPDRRVKEIYDPATRTWNPY